MKYHTSVEQPKNPTLVTKLHLYKQQEEKKI